MMDSKLMLEILNELVDFNSEFDAVIDCCYCKHCGIYYENDEEDHDDDCIVLKAQVLMSETNGGEHETNT